MSYLTKAFSSLPITLLVLLYITTSKAIKHITGYLHPKYYEIQANNLQI